MAILLLFLSLFMISSSEAYIGVTYDTVGDNMPSVMDVGNFLNKTFIRHVRLMNMDQSVIATLAGYNMHLVISTDDELENQDIIAGFDHNMKEVDWASALLPWANNIDMFVVASNFIGGADKNIFEKEAFFKVMKRLQFAFDSAKMNIKVTTIINATEVIQNHYPPSEACFKPEYYDTMRNLSDILRENNAPLLVNLYPYYEYQNNPIDESLPFLLFRENTGRTDPGTGLTYNNMFDAQLDAVRNAMDGLEYEDVDIVVAGTGWPAWTDGSSEGATTEYSGLYNKHLVHHLSSNRGTPMTPNKYVSAYIHTLFDADKNGTETKLGFGILNKDLTWRYDII